MPEREGHRAARTTAPLRLAVLGAGPKALFALEALAHQLHEAELRAAGTALATRGADEPPRLEVTVIDPAEHPGTGAAYAPDQSPVLRLNVAARILDAPDSRAFPSFPDWVSGAAPALAREPYPPRAVVGRYLALRWQAMLADLGRHASCTHLRGRAAAVERDGAVWRVEVRLEESVSAQADARRGIADRTLLSAVDEVLIATGHGAGHEGALAREWASALPLRPAVLPVETMLAADQVPPGSRVAVRGGALTFLDAALALTEGRGAEFTVDPEHPERLVHRRSPQEPATLLPTARHGLLLDAKPNPGTALAAPVSAALDQGARRLEGLDAGDPALVAQVLSIITEAATALLAGDEGATGAERSEEVRRAVERTLATGAEPDLVTGAGRAEQALRRSVAVAQGRCRPGPAWALGRAWSLLYPQLTALLRGNDLPPERWQELRDAAQVLERFAFGPPLLTVQKLLAMVDSGAVDLRCVDAGATITADGLHGIPPGMAGADLVIDAVLPPPGILSLTDPLPQQLLREGLVTVRTGRRGAVVEHDGTAITTEGARAEGLALIGRPTEDHVIGHDTLNRHLHGEISRWAARLAARPEPARADLAPTDRASTDRAHTHSSPPEREPR